MLTALRRQYPDTDYVFSSERKRRLTTASVRKMLARAGQVARLTFPVHPHQLRHSTGFALANDGVDPRALQRYMGHKKIEHALKYASLHTEEVTVAAAEEDVDVP